MKALVLEAYNELRIQEAPEPRLAPDEVMVEVKACGICGSDVHGMDGSSGRRIPPLIMGHEASGVIVATGSASGDWKEGDRVTFDSTIYCGECGYCVASQVNLCEDRRVLGVSCGEYRRHGAFAERVNVPARVLYRVPDSVTFEQAAFVEPVSIALHGVNRVGVQAGEKAVVVGAGMIGLLVLQALKRAGCAEVCCVDLDEKRLARATELGADAVFEAGDTAVEQVIAWSAGNGVDIAMEVVGITPSMQTAMRSVRKGGRIGCVGNLAPMVEFPLQELVTRELTAFGSCASNGEYAEALECIQDGSIRVEPLTSAVVPLAEGAEWFGRLYGGKEDLMKVILRPND